MESHLLMGGFTHPLVPLLPTPRGTLTTEAIAYFQPFRPPITLVLSSNNYPRTSQTEKLFKCLRVSPLYQGVTRCGPHPPHPRSESSDATALYSRAPRS